ncbi:glycosyltransferase family 4 protein [Desulfogranum japonicum]|uniref:glycosyltransferase family 4 protein n=1 Tax=Desulfogranum japonicum TaxID=231447 RepID=UPI0003F6C0BE|nr:glycosyltransferase family 4 protein [Desulfogranum japonicum]
MKILFIHRVELGRSEQATVNYIPCTLAQQGHQVSMVAASGGSTDLLESNGVTVYYANNPLERFYTIRRVLKSFSPDIVHVFTFAGFGLIPFLSLGIKRPKYVCDIRSPLVWKGIMRKIIQSKSNLERKGYDLIFSHSELSAKTVFGKEVPVTVVPPGVDLLSIPTIPIKTEARKFVYIGSLNEGRELGTMLRAFAKVAAENKDITLDIYGNGNIKESLEQLVASLKLSDRILFHGAVERKKLFSNLVEYDVGLSYVPKGILDGGPPLKTLEYFAFHMPVVATNTVGNLMFVNSENGVITQDDIESYAQGIRDMVNSSNVPHMSKAARESVEIWGWQSIVSRIVLPSYEKVLTVTGHRVNNADISIGSES